MVHHHAGLLKSLQSQIARGATGATPRGGDAAASVVSPGADEKPAKGAGRGRRGDRQPKRWGKAQGKDKKK